MVLEEMANATNNRRFTFWKFFRCVMQRCKVTHRSLLIDVMLGVYFSKHFVKNHNTQLLNNMILFLVELTDIAFTEHNPSLFEVLQLLFKKASRKFGRATLNKLARIYQAKLDKESEDFSKSAPV